MDNYSNSVDENGILSTGATRLSQIQVAIPSELPYSTVLRRNTMTVEKNEPNYLRGIFINRLMHYVSAEVVPPNSVIVGPTSGAQSNASPSGALDSPSSSYSSSSFQGLKLRIRIGPEGTSPSETRIVSPSTPATVWVPPTPTDSSPPSIFGGPSSPHAEGITPSPQKVQDSAGDDTGLNDRSGR